jgi:phosphonate transport system substrate-binding protein
MTGWFLACAVALFGVTWSSATWAKVSLVFGTYSSDKPSAMVAQLRPSLDDIAQSMGQILGEEVEINMKVVRSYDDGVALIVEGQVDFMRLGPASYVRAKDDNPGIEVLVMENKHGAKRFNGVIAVHKDSDITDVSQRHHRRQSARRPHLCVRVQALDPRALLFAALPHAPRRPGK